MATRASARTRTKPPGTDSRDLRTELPRLLATARRPGELHASGCVELPVVRIAVDGVGTLGLPIPAAQARALIEHATPAPYGKGLLLITPHAQRIKRLRRARRRTLARAARIDIFPAAPPWDPRSPSAPVLRELSADAQAGHSQLEALAKAFASALIDTPAGARCLASAATSFVRTIPSPLVRSAAQPPATWPAAAAILAAIPGLSVVIDRGLCTYRHGPERGVVAPCDAPSFTRFIERVIERQPTTFKAFTTELP